MVATGSTPYKVNGIYYKDFENTLERANEFSIVLYLDKNKIVDCCLNGVTLETNNYVLNSVLRYFEKEKGLKLNPESIRWDYISELPQPENVREFN